MFTFLVSITANMEDKVSRLVTSIQHCNLRITIETQNLATYSIETKKKKSLTSIIAALSQNFHQALSINPSVKVTVYYNNSTPPTNYANYTLSLIE